MICVQNNSISGNYTVNGPVQTSRTFIFICVQNNSISGDCAVGGPAQTSITFALQSYVNGEASVVPLQPGSTPCYQIQITNASNDGKTAVMHIDIQEQPHGQVCSWEDHTSVISTDLVCNADSGVSKKSRIMASMTYFTGPCCRYSRQ